MSELTEIAEAALAFWPDPDHNTPIDQAEWREWVAQLAPETTRFPFADHHVEFWDWIWSISVGVPPDPAAFAAFWPRGHGKSTSAELAVASLGARRKRRYCVYVCRTQDKADEHVGNIGSVLESPEMRLHYPEMGERLVGLFGQIKGWRRNRLRTGTGFTVDALGLDSAARGTKIDDQRPDMIILDDIDHSEDGDRVLRRNERLLTRAILPAGSDDLVVVFAQNLIHADSLANRLATNEAGWLTDRHVSGPYPAVEGLQYESMGLEDDGRIKWLITGGRATWAGMDLEDCERKMNLFGAEAFIAESQNDVTTRQGALWTRDSIDSHRVAPGYERGHGMGLVQTVVGVDPSVSDSPHADECGIVVVGKGADGRGYVLADRSGRMPPSEWARRVVAAAREFGAIVVAEANQGHLLVKETIQKVDPHLGVQLVHAVKNKELRAQPIAMLYDEEFISHSGVFQKLERQMCLVAGTLIETDRGHVPIEDVTTDDLVMTRLGFAPVKWAGKTTDASRLTTVTHAGGAVTSTRWHRIWTSTRGFVPASDVRPTDRLVVRPSPASMGLPSLGAACGGVSCPVATTGTPPEAGFSIGPSGGPMWDRSLTGSSSTTSTMTLPITDCPTSSASAMPTIDENMRQIIAAASSPGRLLNDLMRPAA